MSSNTNSTFGPADPTTSPMRLDRSALSGLRRTVVAPCRVLLAEDDEEMRFVIALHLRREGYVVTECRDGVELLNHLNGYVEEAADAEQFDLIVSDIRMPGIFGLSVAEGATEYADFPPIILITAFGDSEIHDAARRCGVKAVLDKPFEMPVLMEKAREILGR